MLKRWSSKELRECFLNYFVQKGYVKLPSASLIPKDNSLLLTNAGMVPLKDYFSGELVPDHCKYTSSQRCLRVSGKHDDLANVGKSARHHTFFEMLGNFIVCDDTAGTQTSQDTKKEAIEVAWDFLTSEIGLPKERLRSYIRRLGDADNFWSMGGSKELALPCGPCTEIFWDQEQEIDGERFLELWNVVFMQFLSCHDSFAECAAGPSLSQCRVDTGMGLERLASVVQGVKSTYEIDVFSALMQHFASRVSHVATSPGPIALRIFADHLRAASFLILDGVSPSNVGRGYVLRRIIRRAAAFANAIGATEPILYSGVELLADLADDDELKRVSSTVAESLRTEELLMCEILDRGQRILERRAAKNMRNSTAPFHIDEKLLFELYVSHGVPLDATESYAASRGWTCASIESAQRLIDDERSQSRQSWVGSGEAEAFTFHSNAASSEFTGYERLNERSVRLLHYVDDGDHAFMCIDPCPFYATGGGQVCDTGTLVATSSTGERIVADVCGAESSSHASSSGIALNVSRAEARQVKQLLESDRGAVLSASVHAERRLAIECHHTATHLLHSALKHVLGSGIRQVGSHVDVDHFRFDFSFNRGVTKGELRRISDIVNRWILEDRPVITAILPKDQALQSGAEAQFGEKYGDEVRVVSIGSTVGTVDSDVVSAELCGGTHVRRTGQLYPFIIDRERSVAAGTRRVVCMTSRAAVALLEQHAHTLSAVRDALKTQEGFEIDSAAKLRKQVKQLRKQLRAATKRTE